MRQEKVSVPTRDGPMNLHVFYPEMTEKAPVTAMIVLQEAFGVNQNILEICQRLTREGYLTVAPELYHRLGNDLQIRYGDMPRTMSALGSLTNEDLTEDVAVTFGWIRSLQSVSLSSVGSIGFCMGGFTSILAACNVPLDFAISCYGGGISAARTGIGFMPILDELPKLSCPVFLLYGEKDPSIPLEQVEEVRGYLKRAEREYEIKVYLGAAHAFLRERSSNFHASAAAEAWKDIFSWLKLHIK